MSSVMYSSKIDRFLTSVETVINQALNALRCCITLFRSVMKDFEQWLKYKQGRPSRWIRSKHSKTCRVNKKRKLRYGSIVIPPNDAYEYRAARQESKFFVVAPLDDTRMQFAIEEGLLNKVVFGPYGSVVVEGLILDETGIPWLVPKVITEFRQIDYGALKQSHSQQDFTAEDASIRPRDGKVQPNVSSASGDAFTIIKNRQTQYSC